MLTALAWVVAVVLGLDQQAALALGFIPARLSGAAVPWPAIPAILTPLSATLVHSGLVHLGFNLLIFVWCGTAVERVLGQDRADHAVPGRRLCRRARAMGAGAERDGADDRRERRDQRGDGRVRVELRAGRMLHHSPRSTAGSMPLWLMVAWIVLQMMMGWLAGGQGYLLATPAHVGGFAAGLLLQRPLLLWRYRKA